MHNLRWLEQGVPVSSTEVENVEDAYDLNTIIASRIIPTELNTFLYRYELHLSSMAEALSETSQSTQYQDASQNRKYAINQLLWNTTTLRYR